jgi:hypothetical protein
MAGLIAGAEIMFGGRNPSVSHATRHGQPGHSTRLHGSSAPKVKNRRSLGLDMNNKVELSIADVVQ